MSAPDPASPRPGGDAGPGRPGLRLSARRRALGLVLAALAPPLLTVLLTRAAGMTLGAELLAYLLLVVVVAAVGGIEAALLAAVAGFLLANWFLVEPAHTFSIARRDALVELATFLLVAGVVSLTVHLAAREQARAGLAAEQTRAVAAMSAEPVGAHSLVALLADVRDLLGLSAVALARTGADADPVEVVGDPGPEGPSLRVPAGTDFELLGYGPEPFGPDVQLLRSLAGAAVRAYDTTELARQAATARELATADRVRTGLLAAVGHDLRSPLAAIKAAVGSLRADDVDFDDDERAELLATVEEGTDRLAALVANLLDLSRLQAGSMPVSAVPVSLDEVVAGALGATPMVANLVADDLPPALADPGLLERVVANLVDNAARYRDLRPVEVSGRAHGDVVELSVADHGPGVPPERYPRLFVPFQRLDDRSATAHLGLGLAIAQGFTEAMGGRLVPSTTPGGGLTMTVELPAAVHP